MVDTDDKLPDYITLKNLVTLITCVIQDGAKFDPKIFLEVALYNKKALKKRRMTNSWLMLVRGREKRN